ncbi:MAG: HD domain-containing protein [Thermoanaerobaculaceae bacterium]|nr:HD domain-containing protein [Thermoanaerobaculaceae bacterium]MDI9621948.1 HD domain-containing protein [Acidobacteriota bacterium]NLH12238.1 HD domain-containing protein [Holophagae bacterium]HPW55638.1 HD domain-containing protein [Thermoanaerobaculaceae bacterium]
MPPHWPFSRSLLYPLTAVLVALAVVPVGMLGWGFVTSNREQVATLEKQYLTRQSVGLASEIELRFLGSVGRLRTAAEILRSGAKGPLDGEAASALLRDLAAGSPSTVLLRLLDDAGKGTFLQGAGLSDEALRRLEPRLGNVFTATLQGEPVNELIERLPSVGSVILVSLPVRDAQDEVVGVLQGVVALQDIASLLVQDSGLGVTVDVVDHQGMVLFSSDRNRVGRDARANPLVAQFVRRPVRLTMTYQDPLRGDGSEMLGSLCPVGDPSWAVVTARDVDVAFAAVNAMAARSFLLAVLTGLVAMLAGIMLARRITLPLRKLADVTTAVAGGDFTQRAPVASRNEMGQLAENFNVMTDAVDRYVRSLRQALQENEELLIDSIRALAAAIDAKNPYTRGHSERVSQYAVAVAHHFGVKGRELKQVEIAALLHDVGKIGIEDAILLKPEALTAEEFAQMRNHVVKGAAIVSPIKRLKDMLPGIRSHHENWDGSGYPDRLQGDAIPLVARLIAIADVFDAMTTDRPYQKGMSLEAAMERLRAMAGQRLDPKVVDAFFGAVRAGDLVPIARSEVA